MQNGDAYARLLDLLLVDERDERATLAAKVDRLDEAVADLPQTLPAVIAQADARDAQSLSASLYQPLRGALRQLARDDSPLFVSLLFPIIGPLIRRAISEALGNLVVDLNRTLEHSVSVRGLRWRLEALRTGEPFAKVVLKHTLRYRVEHLFWIHAESGELLAHVANVDSQLADSDAVAGMLTAIGDFVRDAVLARADESLHAIDLGELTVRLWRSPATYLAVATRGVLPSELTEKLALLNESLHRHADMVAESERKEQGRQELETWLGVHGAALAQAEPSGPPWRALIVLGLVAVVLSSWLGMSIYRNTQASAIADRLQSMPGYRLVQVEWRDGRYAVHGERDAFAQAPPDDIAARAALTFSPYLSLAPEMLERRARARLPASVAVATVHGRLQLKGVLQPDVREAIEPTVQALAMLAELDLAGLQIDSTQADRAALREEIAAASSLRVYFDDGLGMIDDSQAQLDRMAAQIAKWQQRAQTLSMRVLVTVTGATDGRGTERTNVGLRAKRAALVRAALQAAGLLPEQIDVRAGSAAARGDLRPALRSVQIEVGLVATSDVPAR